VVGGGGELAAGRRPQMPAGAAMQQFDADGQPVRPMRGAARGLGRGVTVFYSAATAQVPGGVMDRCPVAAALA